MKQRRVLVIAITIFLLIFSFSIVHAQTDTAMIRAVLFYSPTCPHCELVINNTILPLVNEYGDQLQVVGIDVTQPQGQQLFLSALEKFGQDEGGVPFLVIEDTFLVGSGDIPEKFPAMIEDYLDRGGTDWPQIPGLLEVLPPEAAAPQTDPTPASVSPSSTSPTAAPATLDLPTDHDVTWQQRFAYDPTGNTLAVIILAAMLGAVGWTVLLFRNDKGISLSDAWIWLIPALSVIGLGVAGYLAYVEMFQVTAVCGPVGDCNTVQQSEYARLFGILPIGVLGLAGYVAIILAWLVSRYTAGRFTSLASLTIFGMTIFGTIFSIYLTFLEPFVIGATCAWCLTSAMLMTVLMLLSVQPAKQAWQRMALE